MGKVRVIAGLIDFGFCYGVLASSFYTDATWVIWFNWVVAGLFFYGGASNIMKASGDAD
jgi:succinate-acetate transporter protein